MSRTFTFATERVCPKLIKLTLDGNIIQDVQFLGGGCSGNLQALPRLVKGLTVDEVQQKLAGISCGGKGTSCADQLAKAVNAAFVQSKNCGD